MRPLPLCPGVHAGTTWFQVCPYCRWVITETKMRNTGVGRLYILNMVSQHFMPSSQVNFNWNFYVFYRAYALGRPIVVYLI